MKIIGEKVIIRPTEDKDLENIQGLWNNGDVMESVGYPDGLGQTYAQMGIWFKNLKKTDLANHYVVLDKDNKFCGELLYRKDPEYKRAGLDIKFLPEAQGRGLATEALQLFIEYIFNIIEDVEAVWTEPAEENTAARDLYTRAGLQEKERPADLINEDPYWELTKADWQEIDYSSKLVRFRSNILMKTIDYKDVYTEGGRKVLEVGILPGKYCNFDCVFCPFSRTDNKVDQQQSFEGLDSAIEEFGELLEENKLDLVYLSSTGESILNQAAGPIIDMIKAKGISVRLLSNGYLLGVDKYLKIASKCDEVIGEIAAVTEADFQKLQRPMTGYNLEEYIFNMVKFNQQYDGVFILDIAMLKGYNDDEVSIQRLKGLIEKIAPDRIVVNNVSDPELKKQFGVSTERLNQIREVLANI